jgi:PAS domain S-box-containing protein
MERSIFHRWPIPIRTKLLVLVMGTACLPVLALALVYYQFAVESLRQRAQDRAMAQVRVTSERIHNLGASVREDLTLLAGAPQFESIARDGDSSWHRAVLAHLFETFSATHGDFEQVRFILADGMEAVRVNRRGEEITVVPDQMLQNKALRYYFQEIMALQQGQVYVSSIDLNVEWGRIEEPKRSIIRFGTPLFSPSGEPRGAIVLNLLGEHLLNRLERVNIEEGRRIWISDEEGVMLAAGRADGRGGLSFTLERERGLPGEFPAEALRDALETEVGVFSLSDGALVAHTSVVPSSDIPRRYWKIFISVPAAAMTGDVSELTYLFLTILAGTLGIAVLIGVLVARHFVQPIDDLKAGTRALAKGDYDVKLEILTNDEIEELAYDFQDMAGQLKAKDESIHRHNDELEETVALRSKEIVEEKQKLDSIVDSLGAALALIDTNFVIRWHNNMLEEWYGESLVGRHCCDVYRPGKGECENCGLQAALRQGRGLAQEGSLWNRDGQTRDCLETVRPIFDDEGKVKYLLKLSQDITEHKALERKEKELERQLVQADRLSSLGEFSAGIAHEIGNPLASMKLNAQILARERDEDNGVRVPVERIIDQIDRLDGIVKRFSEFARPGEVRPISFPVQALVSDIFALTGPSLRRHGVEPVRRIDPGVPDVYVDVPQIQQVLLNLILNATQAMPDGGVLTVTGCREGPDYVRLAIADTGPGIPHRDRDKIFDPFVTTKRDGTGLGLSIAYNLVKNNGGKLSLGAPLTGAEFVLCLPLARSVP